MRNTSSAAERTGRVHFAEQGRDATAVRREIAELCAGHHAYADGTVVNSICSEPVDLAREVYAEHLTANFGDNRIFPGLSQVQARVTAMLGELLGAPEATGGLVSGGTEANLLALVAALRAGRVRAHRPVVLVPDNAHFSFAKLAAILPVELVGVRVDGRFRVDPDDVRRKLTRDTALVVATAGTSECGAVDDVAAVAAVAEDAGVPVHVDAATGGFLIPFARDAGYPLPPFDFSVPGVTSITVDPHKYGLAPIPAGYLLFRDEPVSLRVASHYRGTDDHVTLLGTRPGASVLAVYAALRHLGRDGYRTLVADLFAARDRLVELLTEHGHPLAFPPDLTILGIRVADSPAALAYLERRGVIASVSKRHAFLRVVVHRHLRAEHYAALVAHLDDYRSKPCA